MNRRFALPPTGLFARFVPFLVGGLLPIAFAGSLAFGFPRDDFPWVAVVFALVAMPLAGVALAATLHGRIVVIRDRHLRVRRWPAPRDFPLASIDLGAARVADLAAERELQPVVKLMGTRMPGMRSGWFLTRGKRRAYVLTTTRERVAALPLRDGRLLLLGVERPEALLQALRDDDAARR